MARKFFYVSAGVFLLASTYYLGAVNATGQGGIEISAQNGALVVSTDGGVYESPSGNLLDWVRRGQISGLESPAVGVESSADDRFVFTRDARIYVFNVVSGTSEYRGNSFGAATAATRSTTGRVMGLYRR